MAMVGTFQPLPGSLKSRFPQAVERSRQGCVTLPQLTPK